MLIFVAQNCADNWIESSPRRLQINKVHARCWDAGWSCHGGRRGNSAIALLGQPRPAVTVDWCSGHSLASIGWLISVWRVVCDWLHVQWVCLLHFFLLLSCSCPCCSSTSRSVPATLLFLLLLLLLVYFFRFHSQLNWSSTEQPTFNLHVTFRLIRAEITYDSWLLFTNYRLEYKFDGANLLGQIVNSNAIA